MKKTVSIILKLKGDWTGKEKTERIMRIEGISMHAEHISTYNEETKETCIIIKGHEYEINESTGEVTPLCHWLSHDTCILYNICCDGKGRCKYIMKEGADDED